MYDPTVGRFLSEDPSEYSAGDPNLYRYVHNEVTTAVDPSGTKIVHMTNTRSGAKGYSDFYGYLKPGERSPDGTEIELTPDEKQLEEFAHGDAVVETGIVKILNAINHSGTGKDESRAFKLFSVKANGNEPKGDGYCYAWVASQSGSMPNIMGKIVSQEVSWVIYNGDEPAKGWGVDTEHAAIRIEFPGVHFTSNGKLAVAYVDNESVGKSDHIFFQTDIPDNLWQENPSLLSDRKSADHAGVRPPVEKYPTIWGGALGAEGF